MLEGETSALEQRSAALRPSPEQWLHGIASVEERAFLEGPDPILVYEPGSLEICYANEAAADLYGYQQDVLSQLTLRNLIPVLGYDQGTQTHFAMPFGVAGPIANLRADGSALTVRFFFSRLSYGSADLRLAALHDMTARHGAEEALRASEERYRELFENANDVIFLHDLEGSLQAVNRATEVLTGYPRSELLHQDFAKVVAEEAHQLMRDNVRAHLGGGPTKHFELPIVPKSGDRRYLEVSTRILYRKGLPVAVQGIGRDVTERKKDQQKLIDSALALQAKNVELSTALRLAREATQLKEQFLANTSHELRTPMNGIMGMLNLMKDTALSEEQTEYVEDISQCATDLLTIINDLLDVSQIEAGRMSITEDLLDIRESVNSIVKMLGLKADAKGLALTYSIDDAIPGKVLGDSVRFRQVLMNLIANAVKFTMQGDVHVRVELSPDRSVILCEVIDSGIGVEEAVQDRIFEAFFQADGTLRRRFGGTGLGLTISKQLVEIMGGRIGMHNNTSKSGATFWFELPLRVPEPAGAALR